MPSMTKLLLKLWLSMPLHLGRVWSDVQTTQDISIRCGSRQLQLLDDAIIKAKALAAAARYGKPNRVITGVWSTDKH